MDILPHDIDRHVATFLPLLDLARWNIVRRNSFRDMLIQRARARWRERLGQIWQPQPVIPRFCVTSMCVRKRTAEFINLVDRGNAKRLHYCGYCLTTMFMDESSPLFNLYPRIVGVA